MVRARIFLVAVVVVFFCSCLAFGQNNQVVRVGVAPLENRSNRNVPPEGGRDSLVLAINQLKPDKKTHMKLEAVPLDGSTGNEITDDASKKNCDYIVYPVLLQLNELEPGVLQPGTISTDPSSALGLPNAETQTKRPGYEATVAYNLYNIKGHTTSPGPALSGARHPVEQEAVAQVLDRVALNVFGTIRKGGQTHPMREQD
jgi:hypothetical protein